MHFHFDVLGGANRHLQHIPPNVVDGLELDGVFFTLFVALFHVEGGRQPEAFLHIGAPGIEMVVLADVFFRTGKGSVQADDVAAATLDPDAPEKPATRTVCRGFHVEDHGGHRAQKVVADEAKSVFVAIEVLGIDEQHLHETGFTELQVQRLVQVGDVAE